MLADLLLAYTIDSSVPRPAEIEKAVVYLQSTAKEHDLQFPLPNTRMRFVVDPIGVPKSFMGFEATAYAATNLSPCLIVFVDPVAASRQSVIRHEIMHCLGAQHSTDKRDLMFTTGENQTFSKRELALWKRK